MKPLTRFDALDDMTEQGLKVYPRSAYESMADKLTARVIEILVERRRAKEDH